MVSSARGSSAWIASQPPSELLHLDADGDAVDPVVGREDARDLVVAAGEAAGLVEVPEPDAARHRRVVDVGDVIGVVDLVEQLEAPLFHGPAEVVLAAHPERDRAGIPGVRAEVRIAEPLRERARLASGCGGAERRPVATRDQRPRARP